MPPPGWRQAHAERLGGRSRWGGGTERKNGRHLCVRDMELGHVVAELVLHRDGQGSEGRKHVEAALLRRVLLLDDREGGALELLARHLGGSLVSSD